MQWNKEHRREYFDALFYVKRMIKNDNNVNVLIKKSLCMYLAYEAYIGSRLNTPPYYFNYTNFVFVRIF